MPDSVTEFKHELTFESYNSDISYSDVISELGSFYFYLDILR